jgi:hypothetical protein
MMIITVPPDDRWIEDRVVAISTTICRVRLYEAEQG